MKIKILSPLWGHEHIPLKAFLQKVKDAGYDGVETWLPDNAADKKLLFDFMQKNEMHLVCHQHEARGNTFSEFKDSYVKNLGLCAEPAPLLINSHTGKDYFTFDQNLELVDAAQEFSDKTGVTVVHETHRGRVGYSPKAMAEFFEARKRFGITADFSHWVCVTESMLDNFEVIVDEAIRRSRYIHARIGYEQGPQVNDPRAPEWQYAVGKFFHWWDRIVAANNALNTAILPITTEFGPSPYMPTVPFSKRPLSDQFEVNCYMKDLLYKRYGHPGTSDGK
jgi:sugar phosphate isomerase/epimerase